MAYSAPGSGCSGGQSPDIKVNISPFHAPALGDVDFAVFADDQSRRANGIEFAVGLRDERPQWNRLTRVYVQVHNRGIQDATNVAVKVFMTPAAGTLQDLPANFWSNFLDNTVPTNAPWQSIVTHKTIASLAAGRSSTIGFDWTVPVTEATNLSLLAIITTDNDMSGRGAGLMTGNRASGDDSLAQMTWDYAGADSLPVVTIGAPQRLVRDRAYASECAMRLLDLLERIET